MIPTISCHCDAVILEIRLLKAARNRGICGMFLPDM